MRATHAPFPAMFPSVMGTGILAIGIAASPVPIPGRTAAAVTLWLLAGLIFVVLLGRWLTAILRHPSATFAGLANPVTAQAWGAPPMAAFTVAVGFLIIGPHVLAATDCVRIAQVLFVAGVLGSIGSAVAVPLRLFTEHDVTLESVGGSWLLPVVPPIVASVPAALLEPYWPESIRSSMLALAYGLLGMGLILAALVIAVFFLRLVLHKVPHAPLVPAMWIVVGPLGQSIAGFIALGNAARGVWPAAGNALAFAGVAYGVVVWGFAMYWLAMAIIVTLRARADGIPFSLGWWAFTFPVGVLTAGTVALDAATHATLYRIAAVVLLALLAAMWLRVAAATISTVRWKESLQGARQTLRIDGLR